MKQEKLFSEYPEVVGIEELMQMLRIGKTLAYKLIKEEKIESRKIGRQYKITKEKIIEYMQPKEKKNDRTGNG